MQVLDFARPQRGNYAWLWLNVQVHVQLNYPSRLGVKDQLSSSWFCSLASAKMKLSSDLSVLHVRPLNYPRAVCLKYH